MSFGGVIQPLVGATINASHQATELLVLVESNIPGFGTYQRGLL